MKASPLSTLQRSLIAFSALYLGYGPRATVLATHQVTEADLRRHRPEWEHLQARRATNQSRYEPADSPVATSQKASVNTGRAA